MSSKFENKLKHIERKKNVLKSIVSISKNKVKSKLSKNNSNKDFCYNSLTKVSRSFALVIQQLPEDLKDTISVFYLVLRALDSIEDDMKVEKNFKDRTLKSFYTNCNNSSYCLMNIGENENEVELLENYYKVARFMNSLKPKYQEAIINITKLMGKGMADFSENEIDSIQDYNKYCYYVAGLVGIGLSDIFSISGFEEPFLKNQKELSNDMGLLLQKTNITRDYWEDIYQDRFFWPDEIWKKYANEKDFFIKNPDNTLSLNCLNEMIINALDHLPKAIEYMKMLKNEKVFRFCAIPQIMAIATLSKIYNNTETFKSIVKIDRNITLEIFSSVKNIDDFKDYYQKFISDLNEKNLKSSIHYLTLNNLINRIEF